MMSADPGASGDAAVGAGTGGATSADATSAKLGITDSGDGRASTGNKTSVNLGGSGGFKQDGFL
jgi:hypothetical protein